MLLATKFNELFLLFPYSGEIYLPQ